MQEKKCVIVVELFTIKIKSAPSTTSAGGSCYGAWTGAIGNSGSTDGTCTSVPGLGFLWGLPALSSRKTIGNDTSN